MDRTRNNYFATQHDPTAHLFQPELIHQVTSTKAALLQGLFYAHNRFQNRFTLNHLPRSSKNFATLTLYVYF
jgi:hypothetical protein